MTELRPCVSEASCLTTSDDHLGVWQCDAIYMASTTKFTLLDGTHTKDMGPLAQLHAPTLYVHLAASNIPHSKADQQGLGLARTLQCCGEKPCCLRQLRGGRSAGSQDQLMFLNSRGTGPSKKEIVEAHPRWLRKQHFKIVRVSKIHDMMAKCGAA